MANRIAVKKFPCVFYRESVKRVHNGKPDKSFCFCYEHQGKKHWETVGWAKGEGRHIGPDEDRYRNHLKTVFANLPIDLITPEMPDQLKTELSAKLAPARSKRCSRSCGGPSFSLLYTGLRLTEFIRLRGRDI